MRRRRRASTRRVRRTATVTSHARTQVALWIPIVTWLTAQLASETRAARPRHERRRRRRPRVLREAARVRNVPLVGHRAGRRSRDGIVLPGAAMLAGTWLDERIAEASSARGRARGAATAAAFAGAALVVLLRHGALAGRRPAQRARYRALALGDDRSRRIVRSSASFAWSSESETAGVSRRQDPGHHRRAAHLRNRWSSRHRRTDSRLAAGEWRRCIRPRRWSYRRARRSRRSPSGCTRRGAGSSRA